MKKTLFLFAILMSGFLCYAQLDIHIPFDTNVVGQAWSGTNYTFTSDYFYVTNLAETSEFTITVTSEDLPEDWNLMWCHDGLCSPTPVQELELMQNVEMELDFIISPVASASGCHIQFKFESESLVEPEYIDFYFQTEDASNADITVIPNQKIQLQQNYPNPFNPTTTIRFSVTEASPVNLSIFNAAGQKVITLTEFNAQAGNYEVDWNGKDRFGNTVASGAYFYKLTSGKYFTNKKMILMK